MTRGPTLPGELLNIVQGTSCATNWGLLKIRENESKVDVAFVLRYSYFCAYLSVPTVYQLPRSNSEPF